MFLRVHVVWPDISLIRIDSWAGLIGSGRDEAPPPQEYDGWGRCCCCCPAENFWRISIKKKSRDTSPTSMRLTFKKIQ